MANSASRVVPRYVVSAVRPANASDGAVGADAVEEIAERFEGRSFTLQELEYRAVRIAGGVAVYTANSRDWLLELVPVVAA